MFSSLLCRGALSRRPAIARALLRPASSLSAGSSPLPLEVPASPWPNYVLERASEFGDKPAFIDATDGRALSFHELKSQVVRAASGLIESGFRRGDVLVTNATNCLEYPVLIHAVALVGGIVSPASPLFTVAELSNQLREVGRCTKEDGVAPQLFLFAVPSTSAAAVAAADDVGVPVEHRVLADGCVDDAGAPAAGVGFAELLDRAIEDAPEGAALCPPDSLLEALNARVDPQEDMAILPFSSGTTGPPKGVMLTHRNMVANLLQSDGLEPYQGDTFVGILPMYHIYGTWAFLSYAPRHGATVALLPRFELGAFLKAIETYRVSLVHIAPPVAVLLAKDPRVDEYDVSSVRAIVSGAAPLGEDTAAQVAARLDCVVKQAYGMTELSPINNWMDDGGAASRAASIGPLVGGTDYKVLRVAGDETTDEVVAVGEVGELCWRGPQVMKGYLNRPDATAATIDGDGFLHSGDIGHVDNDGYFYVVDRKKELVKYKGRQVAPAELEALLLEHESIADACVVAHVRKSDGEEVPKAFVVRKPNVELSADDVQAFVAGRVASYKKVRAVEFIDAIPKSASGKLLRRQLRERDQG